MVPQFSCLQNEVLVDIQDLQIFKKLSLNTGYISLTRVGSLETANIFFWNKNKLDVCC